MNDMLQRHKDWLNEFKIRVNNKKEEKFLKNQSEIEKFYRVIR